VVANEAGEDRMTLRIEREGGNDAELAARVESTLRDVAKLRGEVRFEPPGTLPNDGKVIEDARAY